ncbi:MAG TPA: ATP-binding protein [Mariprofundaceae bacterium]|nr:ATP-binding protein [Mariprofundaceae bacterium]
MSGWLVLIAGIIAMWVFSAHRMRQQLRQYQSENRRLRESSGGLESNLASSGRRLDALLSAVNEAVLRLDQKGRVLAANERAREIFSIQPDVSFPQPLRMFYRDADWHDEFARSLKALPEISALSTMKLKKKVLAPRLAQLGRDQALLLCMDITEQFRLERQRRTLLSNLMHDLKTPLTSLLGYARSLESFGDDPAFRKEAAQVIADEARHVNHLLDALLTLDQIEFAVRDQGARCDAASVLQKVCDALKPQLESKSSHLHDQVANGIPAVAMQADDLERALTNVLENSIRYTPPGSNIQVRMGYAGGMLVVTVEDDGPGVPEKKLPRLTERFYRVDKARARKAGGHGLGLAIVQEIIDVHGGRLSFANIEPHGLSTEFTIPLWSEAS